MMVWFRLCSFSTGVFSGSMLIFWGICFESYFFTSLSRCSAVSFSFCTKTFRCSLEKSNDHHMGGYINTVAWNQQKQKNLEENISQIFWKTSLSWTLAVGVCQCMFVGHLYHCLNGSISLCEVPTTLHPPSSLACGGSNSFPKAYAGGCEVSKELNPLECIHIQCKKHPNCLRFGKILPSPHFFDLICFYPSAPCGSFFWFLFLGYYRYLQMLRCDLQEGETNLSDFTWISLFNGFHGHHLDSEKASPNSKPFFRMFPTVPTFPSIFSTWQTTVKNQQVVSSPKR